jgi:ribosomal protein S6--L-glutamate ligase
MRGYTVGMWMYQDGGGDLLQQKLVECLREREINVISGLHLQNAIASNGSIECNGIEMENLDLYFSYNAGEQTEYQVYLYQMLDMSIPCINSFAAFTLSEDKFKTSHLLKRNGIPTGDYQLCHCDDMSQIESILNRWEGSAVFKPTDGWGGRDIIKIESLCEVEKLLPLLKKYHQSYFYLEKFLDYDNTDYRIDIVDGAFVGCYGRRAAPGEWKTNVTSGGSIILREPNRQLIDLAINAAQIVKLDIAGVDLIFDRKYQKYRVLEVNGIPAFATPEQEKLGLNFNHLKIEKLVNLIEQKIKGRTDEVNFIRQQSSEKASIREIA